MEEELSELLSIARCAANAGAEEHRRAIEKGTFRIDTKASPSDLVTEIDRQSEQEIVSTIRAARPNDEIIGEEGANFSGDSRVRWILDPLVVVANAGLSAALVTLLTEAGAIELVSPEP